MGSLAAMVGVDVQALLRSVWLRRATKVIGIQRAHRSSFNLQTWTVIWQDDANRFGVSDPQFAWFHAREPPAIAATITIYADPTGRVPPVWEGDCGAR